MGSRSNYRKATQTLRKSLDLFVLEQELATATAAYELEVALGVRMPRKPGKVVRYGWNLSQDQLDDMQRPGTSLVEVNPDGLPDQPAPTPASTGSDQSPQAPVRLNPGQPVYIDPDNAARMPRKALFSILPDTRGLQLLGVQI